MISGPIKGYKVFKSATVLKTIVLNMNVPGQKKKTLTIRPDHRQKLFCLEILSSLKAL